MEELREIEQDTKERELDQRIQIAEINLSEARDKNKREYQEYVEKSEAVNLTPFSAMVLMQFFENGNFMSFNRAADRLKTIEEQQGLDFITLGKDPSMKRIQAFSRRKTITGLGFKLR